MHLNDTYGKTVGRMEGAKLPVRWKPPRCLLIEIGICYGLRERKGGGPPISVVGMAISQ